MGLFEALKASRINLERRLEDEVSKVNAEAALELRRLEGLLETYTPIVEPVVKAFAAAVFPDLRYQKGVNLGKRRDGEFAVYAYVLEGAVWNLERDGWIDIHFECFATVRLAEERAGFACHLTTPAKPEGEEYRHLEPRYRRLEARSDLTAAALERTLTTLYERSHWPR